jgi:hypothetical protein
VGENDDDRNEDERARAGNPQKRLLEDACACGGHRPLTLPGPGRHVKGPKTDKSVDDVRHARHCGAQMSRRTNAVKKSITAFVAPFTLR